MSWSRTTQDQSLFSSLMTRSVPSSRDRWIHTAEGPGPLGPIWPRRTFIPARPDTLTATTNA